MKKTITTLTLAAIMLFGSTLSFAGIIISDKADQAKCTERKNDGIIIFGREGTGIIIFGTGIIIFGNSGSGQCADDANSATPGIIISD